MENFTSDIQKILKPAASFSELNSNMELLNNLSESNPSLSSHVHGLLDYLSNNSFPNSPNTSQPRYTNQHQFSLAGASGSTGSHQSGFCPFDQTNAHVVQSLPSIEGGFGIDRHEKNAMPMSEFAEISSSPGFGSESGGNNRIDRSTGGRKRKRKTEGELEKPKEVIHVRAKRGQATDSHSLAERVRRERINEKLRLLQDLVPGCYKTMGMAVMLDVIINYVRSLQNQIEFLSMKLSAASLFYDFNSPEAEALETLQQRTTNPYEPHETEKVAREEYGGMPTRVHSTWPF